MKKTIRTTVFGWISGFVLLLGLGMSWWGVPLLAQESDSVQPPEVEIYATNGFYQWLETSPYLEKISNTPFWDDLKLSSQFLGLTGLRQRLENQVGVTLTKSIIKEFASAPMEISLWNAFDENNNTVFVLVLDVEPRLQALVKLMEIYTKSTNKSETKIKNNLEIQSTRWGEDTLFHLLLKNQLILSNNENSLLYICGKANNGNIKTFRNSEFFRQYLQPGTGNVKCRVELMALLKNFKSPMDKESMQIGISMDLGQTVNFYNLTVVPEPSFEAVQTLSLTDCAQVIPRDPIWTYAGVMPIDYYVKIVEELPGFESKNEISKVDVNKDVIPFFTNRFFFYVNSFQDQGHPNFLDGLLGFSLKSTSRNQRNKLISFVRMVITRKDMGMRLEAIKGEQPIYRYDDEKLPAFCVLDNWLLIGTNYNQLKESLEVFAKRKPSIADSQAFRNMEAVFSKKGYCQMLFNPSRFFQNIGSHISFLAASAEDYDVLDVKTKIQPALDILSSMPAFGIFLEKKDKNLIGNIKFERE